jgi:TonB-linked SusC/RagA family outer membrane protein
MKNASTFFMTLCVTLILGTAGLPAAAQQHGVHGVILDDATGDPVPGTTIGIQGTASGAVAGPKGEFSLMVSPGQTLLIRAIGYGAETLKYTGQREVTVRIKTSATSLNQLVVVGYGTQSRATITSSVAKLDPDVLKNAPRSNIGSALQGTLPGLQVTNRSGQPGASPSVVLRGGAALVNPGGPLVVVDGIIRPYNDIPSEDIASIQLLKDAAATAIYGARANNGVLLITTKKGAAGQARITYKFTQGFNTARRGYKFLNAHDFIYYNRLGNLNSGRTLAQVNSSRGYGLQTDAADLASFDIREYGPSTAGLLAKGWDTVGDPYGGTIIFKDHSGEVADVVFRNTRTDDHYLDASGGNDKGTYFTSFDYYKEQGVIVGSSYKRFSGSINGSYKVKPNVTVTSGVTASTSSQLGVNGSEVNNMYRNLALWPTFNPWLDSAKTQPNPGNGVNDGNPLYWLSKQDRSDEVNRITANASVQWDILPGLYVKGTGSGYLYEDLDQGFSKATQTYAQLFANPPSPGNTTRQSYAYFDRTFQQQFDGIVGYTKTFGKHDLNLMLGEEYYDKKELAMQVLGTQAPTDDIPTVNAATVFTAGSNYSTKNDYRILSTFGRLNYNYDQRYLITLVARRDGVSSLPSRHRFGVFPGMSAGWNIQKEAFFSGSTLSRVISTLKPRISYGINGNVSGLGDYEVQGAYGSLGLYNGEAGFLNTGIINSNLEWERSTTTDLGADIGFLQDRITLIFDYYNRKTSDLLANLPLPSYTGFSTVRTNLGTFQNRGVEFSLNANLINRPDGLRWDVGANASFNNNKILKLPPNGQPNNRQGGFQIYDPKAGGLVWVGGYQQGQPLGAVYAFKQVSIFKDQADVDKIAANRYDEVAQIAGPDVPDGPGVSGRITPGDVNWKDVDHNDTIDTRDMVYIGNITPTWTGGFSTTLAYKGFSLYTRFQFALGYVIYNDYKARILGNYQGTFNYITEQKDSWSPTHENTTVPKVYYADQVSAPLGKKNYTRINNAGVVLDGNNSSLYENGGYLACREVTLSYDVASSFIAKTRALSSARLFLSLNNLFYLTKFSGPTPEPPTDANGNVTGIYQGTYPTPRSFIFGIQASF